MLSLIRETVFGRLLRIVTGRRTLPFEEERDAALCVSVLVDAQNQSRDGSKRIPQKHDDSEEEGAPEEKSSDASTANDIPDSESKTLIVVDWYGPNDQGDFLNVLRSPDSEC